MQKVEKIIEGCRMLGLTDEEICDFILYLSDDSLTRFHVVKFKEKYADKCKES